MASNQSVNGNKNFEYLVARNAIVANCDKVEVTDTSKPVVRLGTFKVGLTQSSVIGFNVKFMINNFVNELFGVYQVGIVDGSVSMSSIHVNCYGVTYSAVTDSAITIMMGYDETLTDGAFNLTVNIKSDEFPAHITPMSVTLQSPIASIKTLMLTPMVIATDFTHADEDIIPKSVI